MKKTRDQVSFNGTTIEYEARRSSRRKKTVQISLKPEGIVVAAPARTPDDRIRDMVLKHAPWILEKMAEPSRAPMPLSFVTGETLPYLGSDFPLVVEPGQGPSPQVTFKQDAFHISVPPDLDDDEREKSVLKALAAWYRARAEEYIPGEVDLWWPRLGVKKRSRVIIGSQRSLWGSCAADGTLRFSWRAMMLSPDLIEYIIVHELAHLKIKDHSSRFWKFMARVLPDVRDRRIILRETSRRLPL